jgi:hypothetical protein
MNAIVLTTIVMALPLWWAMGLLALALLGDVSPWWRVRVSRLFDRLDRIRAVPSVEDAALPAGRSAKGTI